MNSIPLRPIKNITTLSTDGKQKVSAVFLLARFVERSSLIGPKSISLYRSTFEGGICPRQAVGDLLLQKRWTLHIFWHEHIHRY